jgi:6-phosphofructokinase 2
MDTILTITLNPAIDKSFTVDRLEPDHKLRSPNPRVDAGGGGINVSRGISRLGGQALAFILAGGHNGRYLQQLIAGEGMLLKVFSIEGETRESIMVMDSATNRQYRIIAAGPQIAESTQQEIINDITSISPFPGIVVASGSLPSGMPDSFYARLARLVKEKGSRLILDCSGDPLKLALQEGVFMVKPNLAELSALAGVSQLELGQVEEAALSLVHKGQAGIVVVSMGASGAILIGKDDRVRIPAPTVKRKSTVGAGDSMVAGMVYGIQAGWPMEQVLQMGVACGTAATMNPGTQLFSPEDARRLFDWISGHKNNKK